MKKITLIILFLGFGFLGKSQLNHFFFFQQYTDTNYNLIYQHNYNPPFFQREYTVIKFVDTTVFAIYYDTVWLNHYNGRNSGNINGNILWLKDSVLMSSSVSNLSIPYSQLTSVPSLQPQLNGTGFVKSTGTSISYDNSTYLTSEVDGSTTNELAPVATMTMYGGTSAPSGYLLCDGSPVSRTTYSALFAVVGTTYGAGDGSTTFNLPDLRQRFPLGKGSSGTGQTLGETGGNIDHLHTVNPPNTTTGAPSATVQATILAGGAASTTHTHDVDIAQFNSGAANPPYITLNFIIKY